MNGEETIISDQPQFNYGEVIKYAKEMGLPTEFPL